MPLYKVKIKTTMLIWLDENANDAEVRDIVYHSVGDELSNNWDGCTITKVKSIKNIPETHRNSIPWGDDVNDAKCAQLIENPDLGTNAGFDPIACGWCGESPDLKCPKCREYLCEACSSDHCC